MAEMGWHEVPMVIVQAQPDIADVPPGAQAQGPARFQWTDASSGFMLHRFVQLVQQGVKTEKGFKEVHLNSVARDVAEYSGQPCTSKQVYEHLRMWCARWIKVCKLKELSGAGWDETRYMIKLEESYFAKYVQAFPKDAKFLNRPISNYLTMQIIFGNGVATGLFAVESNEALGQPSKAPNAEKTELTQEECKGQTLTRKRRQCADNEERFTAVKSTVQDEPCPDIYEHLMNIPGFTREQLMFGLSYFIDNKGPALAFVQKSGEDKVMWLRQFLGKHNIL